MLCRSKNLKSVCCNFYRSIVVFGFWYIRFDNFWAVTFGANFGITNFDTRGMILSHLTSLFFAKINKSREILFLLLKLQFLLVMIISVLCF